MGIKLSAELFFNLWLFAKTLLRIFNAYTYRSTKVYEKGKRYEMKRDGSTSKLVQQYSNKCRSHPQFQLFGFFFNREGDFRSTLKLQING